MSRSIFITLALGLLSFPVQSAALDINQYPALQNLIELMVSEDGYPREKLIKILESTEIDEKTLTLIDKQWESLPWHKYKNLFINENRVGSGVKFWNTHESILDRAYRQYGVPPAVIVALIGVETHYGARIGDNNVLTSLVTLSAAYPRRSSFFSNELRTFLNTTRREKIDPESVVGSYAGAIGIPQFMPTSYEAYAVDFNGNNQRDLVNETDDAIGSVANYLKIHGWSKSENIYSGVRKPIPESAVSLAGKKAKLVYNTAELIDMGLEFDPSGGSEKCSFISLQEEHGERYIVGYRNFYAITRYNPSINYALAVSELSEAIQDKRNQE